MKQFLLDVIQTFQAILNYPHRRADVLRRELAAQAHAERDHQALLLKTFLTSLETIQETAARESSTNAQALTEIAKSIGAQAQSFGEWMKCFQPGEPPTSTTIREEDEYRDEQMRNMADGLDADLNAVPEEFKLAWILQNDPNSLID